MEEIYIYIGGLIGGRKTLYDELEPGSTEDQSLTNQETHP